MFLFLIFVLLTFQYQSGSSSVRALEQKEDDDELQYYYKPTILLTPCEILWDTQVKVALAALRRETPPVHKSLYLTALRQCYDSTTKQLTFTLIGYKGGSIHDQTNQDRAFIIQDENGLIISGVMDGHGKLGHYVSEWSRHEFIKRILESIVISTDISQTLTETLIAIDKEMPSYIAKSGGATASLVLQYDNNIYFCNLGDSQSFIVAAAVRDGKLVDTVIPFVTEHHKPDNPEERKRLEDGGMKVESSSDDDDARAWYVTETGGQYGLAMSRALGDRDINSIAIIAEPTISVFTKQHIVSESLNKLNEKKKENCTNVEINADGSTTTMSADDETSCSSNDEPFTENDIQLFVVSATDGIMDFISPEVIAYQLSQGYYDEKDILVVTADLLLQAATKWQEEQNGRYRDDMAIAISPVNV